MITIYTKENCPACFAAKRFFEKKGVEFEVVDFDEESIAKFKAMSLTSAPVVECRTEKGRLMRAHGGSIHIWKKMVDAIEADGQEG